MTPELPPEVAKANDDSHFEFGLDSIQFSDGTIVGLPTNAVLVLVGPNNSGKSVALSDIYAYLQQASGGKVVRSIDLRKSGSVSDLDAWLAENSHEDQGPDPTFSRHGTRIAKSSLNGYWSGPSGLGGLAPLIVKRLGSVERLQLANSVASFDPRASAPDHPLQHLYVDINLERELSDITRAAFNSGISVDRYSGSHIPLLWGEPEETDTAVGLNQSFLEEIRALPRVSDQGDGIKSLVGIMLSLVGSEWPVLLIDEPEAFLHPPQARFLGRKLAELAGAGTQIVVATHSSDLLQGALSGDADGLVVARVTRDGNENPTSVLDSEGVKELWQDPLLRYSRVLDGLFYRGVVVCEADSDCRFYAAVLDACDLTSSWPASDYLFTHCGGKDRLATVVRALSKLKVPTAVIADFDMLRDRNQLRKLVEAMGGDYAVIERDLHILISAIDDNAKPPLVAYVSTELARILDGHAGSKLTPDLARAAKAVLATDGGWSLAKRSGLEGVPRGEATTAAHRLLDSLSSLGLWIVPSGELESWVPEVSKHGPAWCAEVLANGYHERPELGARAFIRNVASSLTAH